MKLDLQSWLFAMRTSFWPLPILMGLMAIVAALVIMQADLTFQAKNVRFMPMMTMPIESARLALSTIAGSMITIASLVFSMTLVALTLVSQQLGPRILLLFMDDRETQVMLGLFIATFVFALIVLLRVGDEELVGRVPAVAVILTAGLAIFALGMMIRFIHHIATRIQADVLIAELGHDLTEAARKFAKLDQEGDQTTSEQELKKIKRRVTDDPAIDVTLGTSGYLRRLETETACDLAKQHNLVLSMKVRPGQFVLAGTPILAVACNADGKEIGDDLQSELCRLVAVGEKRTPEASVEFEISALVEVALRALSPGINDPFTASACIDRLADGMRTLMQRKTEQRVSRDEDGEIRVVHAAEPFSRYLITAFSAIREAGRNNTLITNRLAKILADLEQIASVPKHRTELKKQSAILKKSGTTYEQ